MGSSKSKSPIQVEGKRPKREVDLTSIPARVDNVKIAGLNRTYDDYVQRAAGGLFTATNFQDVLLEANETREYLNDLGIFKTIDVHIDITRKDSKTPHSYDVTFKGKELSRIVGGIGTEIGQNEGSLTMQLATPNLFGRGEKVTLQGSFSNIKTNDLALKFSKPFYHTKFKDNRPEVSVSLFRHSDKMEISAFKNNNFGVLLDFSFLTYLPFELSHSLQYESAIKDIQVLGKNVPFFIREHCGPRMSSLVRYVIAYDSRDNAVFPNYGFLLKTTNEFCGLGGNIGYMMNNTQTELSIPLFAGFVAQVCSKFGLIQRDKRYIDIPISNLFVFGGNQTLRGFQFGGAGPHVDGYAAGAHSYWSTGLHLWGPLPFGSVFGRFSNNFRSHIFYNFGNVNSFSTDNMKSAAGVGIAYKFADRARIELNYCIPISKQSGDKINKGFQFGIGYEFI